MLQIRDAASRVQSAARDVGAVTAGWEVGSGPWPLRRVAVPPPSHTIETKMSKTETLAPKKGISLERNALSTWLSCHRQTDVAVTWFTGRASWRMTGTPFCSGARALPRELLQKHASCGQSWRPSCGPANPGDTEHEPRAAPSSQGHVPMSQGPSRWCRSPQQASAEICWVPGDAGSAGR